MRLLALLLALLAAPAMADCPIWLSFGGPSKHMKGDDNDNEKNYGPGFQVCVTEDDKVRFAAQIFRNTQRIDGAAVGVSYTPWRFQALGIDVRPGVFAGGLVAYSPQAIYAAAPVLSFEGRHAGVDYLLVREMGGNDTAGWVHWLNFKVRIR